MNRSNKSNQSAESATRSAVEQMPIVVHLVESLKADGFRFDGSTLLFGVQHLMQQSLVLCWALNELGLSYDRIALAGKPYSTNPDVVDQLHSFGVTVQEPRDYDLTRTQSHELIDDIRRLSVRFSSTKMKYLNPTALVIDDGGQALSHFMQFVPLPYRLAGVEQTASGFWQPGFHTVSFPVVDVGGSAVKRICEPAIVADAAMQRIRNLIDTATLGRRAGIIGLGYIGSALYDELLKYGVEALRFDLRSSDSFTRGADLQALFNRCDVIFGCTGVDVTRDLISSGQDIVGGKAEKLLVSLSSGDDEFFTLKNELLANSKQSRSYRMGQIPDVWGERRGTRFRILRNGFPINFDNSAVSAPLYTIQGTIAALIGASCQAFQIARRSGVGDNLAQRTMLDSNFQRWLYRSWRPYLGSAQDERMLDLDEIGRLSAERTQPKSAQVAPAFGLWTDAHL